MTIQHAKVRLGDSCDRNLLNKKLSIFDKVHIIENTIYYNGTLDAAQDLLEICREADPNCEIELHSETF